MHAVPSVALGGACGALARYGAGRLVGRVLDTPFPWSTWTVNLVGCLLIGASIPLLSAAPIGPEGRSFLVVGFLGSFTTFSTYSLDTLALVADGHKLFALANAGGSLVAGLVCVWIGRRLAEAALTG